MGRIGPEHLGRLFDGHAAALALYARQWCAGPEDVVQEAFAALARQRAAPDRPVAWLYRATRNGAIAASRGDRRRRAREARSAPGEAWFAAAGADDRIDAERAARLLAELPAEAREAIVARVWGGLTFEEIARLQGCSLATAHRRYQAGLARLHERLERSWTPPNMAPEAT